MAFDVVEQILLRFDVKDLIRCKSVCKSWQSLISTPRFVKAHLNHTYKNDQNNHQFSHRRINSMPNDNICIVGSSNGLVCVNHSTSSRDVKFVVTNPSTREEKKLQTLTDPRYRVIQGWGFGYDSSSDDYKVIIGLTNYMPSWIRFYMLTLKSNIWKFIGKEVNYTSINNRHGNFCNGALHWFMTDVNEKNVIVSFDLATEEFKEILLPTDKEYYKYTNQYRLGIIEECLCIYSHSSNWQWVMKNDKWELCNNYSDSKLWYDIVHTLTAVVDPQKTTSYVYSHDEGRRVCYDLCSNHICTSIFVKSLISPHGHSTLPLLPGVYNNKDTMMQKRNANCQGRY